MSACNPTAFDISGGEKGGAPSFSDLHEKGKPAFSACALCCGHILKEPVDPAFQLERTLADV